MIQFLQQQKKTHNNLSKLLKNIFAPFDIGQKEAFFCDFQFF